MECTTGTMELFIDKVRTNVALSFPEGILQKARGRVFMRKLRIAIHVARLRTLHSLTMNWTDGLNQVIYVNTFLLLFFYEYLIISFLTYVH